jgi:hypothetical protein
MMSESSPRHVAVMGVQKLLKAGLGGLNNGLGGGGGLPGDFGMDTGCGIGGGHTSMDIGALGDIGDPSSSIGDDLMSTLQVQHASHYLSPTCREIQTVKTDRYRYRALNTFSMSIARYGQID